jgi:pimeloyl-ACP methyl ester carboxylesterase
MPLMRTTVLALALGAGLLIAGDAGATTNSAADKAASVPSADFSGLVDIGGGRKIYMKCQGSGSPTVVLVSGLGNAADIWSVTTDPKNGPPVFDEVAKFTRVCAYDRPGTIRVTDDDKPSPSTPVEQPTSAKPAAADLDALLGASGEPAPYVLVGHSFGGPIIRLYAGFHPAEVGGLVLVDALSEDLPDGLSPKQEALNEELNTPPPGSHREDLDESATFKQLRESPPAPTVPTVVLTADRPQALAKEQLPPGVDQQFANDLWASQLAAQEKLAKKFPGAEHITDTNSTHYIQVYNPQLVSDSIRSVVDAERDGEKTVGDVKGAD